jgi:hypothetical protein
LQQWGEHRTVRKKDCRHSFQQAIEIIAAQMGVAVTGLDFYTLF